jgi:arsenate reductase-like glutaredoxin family protein
MSCKKAQGFLEKSHARVQEIADANKDKRGRAEALALAKTVKRIVVAKGKNIVAIDLKRDVPDDDALAGYLLGPTGNLRAPTVRKGDTLYVGFSEETYKSLVK